MANSPSLQEDFAGASPGTGISTANTIFDNTSGSGTAEFNADGPLSGLQSAEVTTSGTFVTMAANHADGAGLHIGFWLKLVSGPSGNTGIVAGYDGASRAYDLQVQSGGTLRLRNASSATQWTSPALSTGWYWITLDTTVNAYRARIHDSSGTLVSSGDSGTLTTGFTIGGDLIDRTQYGLLSNSTATVRFGRLRGDTSTQPASGVATGAPWTIAQSATIVASGSYTTPVLSQTSGPSVTIDSSGAPTFEVALPDEASWTSDVVLTLTDSTGTGTTETITIRRPGSSLILKQFVSGSWTT